MTVGISWKMVNGHPYEQDPYNITSEPIPYAKDEFIMVCFRMNEDWLSAFIPLIVRGT